jgi:hypothetical protein
MKLLSGPMLLRSFLPAFAVWWLFIGVGLGITHAARPDIDTNGWPFIVTFFPVSCVVFALAMMVGHVLLIRWLIRHRSTRRGRVVALRGVLRPTDAQPSAWRRFWLSLYGVTAGDLGLLPSLWRPAE